MVEDDHLLNSTLCYNLSAGGYKVDSANTKAEAAKYCEEQAYELSISRTETDSHYAGS